MKNYIPNDSIMKNSQLVTVLKANNSAQLIVAKSLLESANIPCFAKGETIQDFFAGGRIGTGFNVATGPVELQVISDNEIEAEAILREIIDDNSVVSSDITLRKTTGIGWKIYSIIIFLVTIVLLLLAFIYKF